MPYLDHSCLEAKAKIFSFIIHLVLMNCNHCKSIMRMLLEVESNAHRTDENLKCHTLNIILRYASDSIVIHQLNSAFGEPIQYWHIISTLRSLAQMLVSANHIRCLACCSKHCLARIEMHLALCHVMKCSASARPIRAAWER